MTVVLAERGSFTLEALARVALGGERVRLDQTALARIEATHQAFAGYVAANPKRFIYGVTSDYGPRARVRLDAEERARLKSLGMPFLGLSYGDGELPESAVRAIVFALLALVSHGGTAVSARQARAVARSLDGAMPRIPAGGLTSPGEMMALFYLYRALPGLVEGELRASGGNSALVSAGLGSLAAIHARRRLTLATRVLALSWDAFRAPLDHLDPALKRLWGDPHEGRAIDALNHWLAGASRDGLRPFQAPVSYRILPRVMGQAERAVAGLEEVAEDALQGLVSNPTFVPPDAKGRGARTLSTGGFHDALTPQALDGASAAWVDLAALAHRHIVKLHKGGVSQLPDRLLPEGVHYRSGRSTTYLEFVPNDWIDEMRRWAQPALLSPGEPGASDQDDVSAPGFIAWRNQARVAVLLDRVLAVLAATASQALQVTGRAPPRRLRPLLAEIRASFPPVTRRRVLGRDVGRLAEALTAAIEDQAPPARATPARRRAGR